METAAASRLLPCKSKSNEAILPAAKWRTPSPPMTAGLMAAFDSIVVDPSDTSTSHGLPVGANITSSQRVPIKTKSDEIKTSGISPRLDSA